MLVHHFVEGLPVDIAQLLRASPSDLTTSKQALAKAHLLMVTKEGTPLTAALGGASHSQENIKLERLENMIESLHQNVSVLEVGSMAAAVGVNQPASLSNPTQKRQCYICRRVGHIARFCHNIQQPVQCYTCGRWGHTKYQCPGNNCSLAPKGD